MSQIWKGLQINKKGGSLLYFLFFPKLFNVLGLSSIRIFIFRIIKQEVEIINKNEQVAKYEVWQ